jgi:ABC-type Fe3+ transport system permease subunit
MKTLKRAIAATELLLIFPAALFMTALFLREIQPEQFEPAHTAKLIVSWYSTGPVWLTLWILLMAMPLAVLVIGGATLVRSWKNDAELRQAARQTLAMVRAHLATLLIALATLAAGGILAIVALHAVTD